MKERPILFSSPMVRAILDGRKTQTRRTINPQPELTSGSGFKWKGMLYGQNSDFEGTCRNFAKNACPYGKPGDRLWVRETWSKAKSPYLSSELFYRADGESNGKQFALSFVERESRWRPSIHMPRNASRILLEVTNVRVERLNDISEDDCYAEGIEELDGYFDDAGYCAAANRIGCCIGDSKPTYVQLWESINGQGSWDLKPFVWCVEFKVISK